jgi:uncharacterized protein YdaT
MQKDAEIGKMHMAGKRTHHVIKEKEGWAVRKSGSERASGVYDTKKKAVDSARSAAKKEGGELVIHARDGQIRESHSYGKDPFPPKG